MEPVAAVALDRRPPRPPEAALRATATPTATTKRHDRGGIPRAVALVTALHLLLLVGYSVLVPVFRAPDEYVHVDLMRHLARTGDYPAFDDLFVSAPVIAARDTSPAYVSFTDPVGAAEAVPSAQRPAFADLGPEVPTAAANQMPQHPPLYYGLGAAVLAAVPDDMPFDRTVAVLRLVDVALVAAVPLLAWATARRLGCPPAVALTAAVLVLAVPQFTHIGSVVNNDVLLVALSAVLFLLAARVVTGDLSRRTAVLAGVVTGLALLTKGFALVLAPWIVGAYLLAPGARDRWRPVLTRLGQVVGLATAIGGWWWVRNVVVHGTVQPGLRLRSPAEGGVDADPVFFLTRFAGRLLSSAWGDFGWLEVSIPPAAIGVATVVLVAAVAAAFVRGRGAAGRARAALFMFPALALVGLVAAGAWKAYLKTGTPYASQGRYLFPGLVGLVVVAAVGLGHLSAGRRRHLPLFAFAGAVAMQVTAVVTIAGRYWAGGSAIERGRALLAFSPWPPALVLFLAAAVVVVAGWTAVELVRGADRRSGGWGSGLAGSAR
ncbi:MAG: ArnT family glycosyltransferase [Acidimicrobiales bacterium]